MYTSFVLYYAKLVAASFIIESKQFWGKFDLLTLIAQTQAKKKKEKWTSY